MKTNDRISEGSKIIVKVDPELAELIPAFLKNRDEDIHLLMEGLKKNNYEIIERTGHGMKGSGSGFGFEAITEIGARIEQAAKHQDTDEVQKGIDELSDYVRRLEVIYE